MSGKPLSKLPDDPDILVRIQTMNENHVPQVAKMHARYMGTTLWGRLGVPFLETVYNALLKHPDFIGYVYAEGEKVQGFIAGSSDGPKMLSEVFKSNAGRFIIAGLKGVAANPGTIGRVLTTFQYFDRSTIPGLEDVKGESMFCAFEKELRGKRISGVINQVLFNELAARGHKYVKITSESDNEGARRQLTSWGFENLGSFKFYGKEMTAWRLDLKASERVNPEKRL